MFAVAKGARKAASRLAGVSEPLSAAVMDLAVGKRNQFVVQAQPLSSFRGLRTDFERLSFALALVELYAAVLPVEQSQAEAYDLLVRSLAAIERAEKPLVALVWAEVALMNMEGFLPQFGSCVVSGEQIKVAEPLVSPHAGGFVSETAAIAYADRFRVRAEVLYGLERLAELDEPPFHLKFAPETLIALLPFWRQITDTAIPANESVVAEIAQAMRSSAPGL